MVLERLDRSIAATFGTYIALYQRYIDDILIISTVALQSLLATVKAFDADIHLTHDSNAHGLGISFPDLSLSIYIYIYIYIDIIGVM